MDRSLNDQQTLSGYSERYAHESPLNIVSCHMAQGQKVAGNFRDFVEVQLIVKLSPALGPY